MSQKSVVITGASKGIGRAAALFMAAQGFHVFAGVRKESDGQELQAEASGEVTPVILDVTKQEQITTAAELVAAQVGGRGLDALVNNAGIAVPGPLELLPIDQLRWQLEVNVVGQIAVTQAFLPLIRQAAGRIINISSMGGRISGQLLGAYSASKFALEALTDALRQELAQWGIEVVSIEPGSIVTPIWETSLGLSQELYGDLSDPAYDPYREAMEKMVRSAQRSAKVGTPAVVVAEVIHRAITTKRPRTRYLVGSDAKFAVRLIAPLPDRLRDRLITSR